MGRLSARDMAEHASLEQGIEWHIMSNHYPPPPRYMVDVATEAVKKARDGNLDSTIELPGGAEHRRYGKDVPVHVIIEAFHLDPWLEGYVYED